MSVTAIRQKMVFTPQQQLENLLAAIARRDQQALAELYDQTHQAVFGLLCRLLPEYATTEEVLLEVYEEVWRQAALAIRQAGKAHCSPFVWLIQLARQRGIDRLKELPEQPLKTENKPARAIHLPENDWQTEQRHLVNRALMRLTLEQRRVLEFTYFNKLSYTETAARLGLLPGKVKAAIAAGMQSLKTCLQPHSS